MAAPCDRCADLTDLRPSQIRVYHDLHTSIDNAEPTVILLDAPSGTGKTRILLTLAEKYSDRVQFAVHQRDTASQFNAETHANFMKEIFTKTFDEILSYSLDNCGDIEALFKLLIIVQKYKPSSTRAIIVDNCSVMNPLMVVALYLVSLMNKITLIFSGNRRQLGPIDKTKLHSRNYSDNGDLQRIYLETIYGWDGRSNFDVLELISDWRMGAELAQNFRSNDTAFLEKVERFGDAVARYKITERAPFHFNLRYLLYCLFRHKFDRNIAENFDNLFMAQFHKVITKRVKRMRVVEANRSCVAPFDRVPFTPANTDDKFMRGLLLRRGMKIIHCSKTGVKSRVQLTDMERDSQTGDLTKLQVTFENGNSQWITRDDFNFYQMLYDNREWLEEQMENSWDSEPNIRNFPLHHYTMTYHVVMGRTISDSVELSTERNQDNTDCDFSDATAVYVGLCSLTSESIIKKFHAESNLLNSFWITDSMSAMDNQKYYYRSLNGCNVNGVNYTEVYTIRDFENNDEDTLDFMKIKRSVYETNIREEDMNTNSQLMMITTFVRDNTDAVRDVIAKIGNSRLEEAKTALSEAYNAWERKIMNE